MATDKINQIYDQMYKSKEQALLNSKNNALSDVGKQEKQAETDAYNYRNQAATRHSQNTQATRDYMARNNLIQSGESVDALVRNNTSFSNNVGGIDNNLLRQKDEYNNNRNLINKNYESDLNSYKADVESQRAKALFEYQEKLRQEELARQQAAARAYSSGGSSRGGSSGSYGVTDVKNDIRNEVMSATRGGNPLELANTKQMVTNAYQQGLLTETDFKNYYNSLDVSFKVNTNAQNKVNNGTYGYSQARR